MLSRTQWTLPLTYPVPTLTKDLIASRTPCRLSQGFCTARTRSRCFRTKARNSLDGNLCSPLCCEYANDRLSIVEQHSVLFVSWNPHSRNGEPYTIPPIPLSEIRAITRHTPALGWHYVIIVLMSGSNFPPLYFNNGRQHQKCRARFEVSRGSRELFVDA